MEATTDELAESLLRAADSGVAHPRPRIGNHALSFDTGQHIQHRQIERRLARGEKLVGVKLGLTTSSQRAEAGHHRPSVGFLTDSMVIDRQLSVSGCLRPLVEPEIVAVLGRTLSGGPYTHHEIRDAVVSCHAGIEVVDPRYDDGAFILPDALADNSSARAVMWATQGLPAGVVDLAAEQVHLEVSAGGVSRSAADGAGELIMGDPWVVIGEVIADLLEQGLTLPEGFAIFTGNMAGVALPVSPGDVVTAQFSTLGSLELSVVD